MPRPDDPLDPELERAARAYHEPPPTPREEMWARIEARRATPPSSEPAVARRHLPRLLGWVVGIAALLALGIGLGRLTVRPPAVQPPATRAVAPAAGAASPRPDERTIYRVAAGEHLGQAEEFLTLFRASVREGRQDRLAAPAARQLLATNRLLLDSRAGTDPRLKLLLEDLELVLAQIAQLSPERGREDIDLITAGLEQGGVLARLRAAVPAGPAVTPRQGAL